MKVGLVPIGDEGVGRKAIELAAQLAVGAVGQRLPRMVMDQSVGILVDDVADVVAVAVGIGAEIRDTPVAATGRRPSTHRAASIA